MVGNLGDVCFMTLNAVKYVVCAINMLCLNNVLYRYINMI